MPLTAAGEADVNRNAKKEIWLTLIEIDHETLNDPIRLVNDTVTLVRENNKYLPMGMEVSLPNDDADQLPKISLKLTDIQNEVLTTLRLIPVQTTERPTVAVRIVLAITPDSTEAGPYNFELESHQRNRGNLTLELVGENILRRAFPSKDILPQFFPRLF